ncbi:CLUMA_CG020118, isoform A [Clunio marinus]|uniref:CLUMA_CG020118, isoform A n=1 Tax=Clunio marinus TaxID=568069 RepID=A0A1J1J888_9DIPT|nr:CLUMA_CG020118, isoform A [Clunio marinus]
MEKRSEPEIAFIFHSSNFQMHEKQCLFLHVNIVALTITYIERFFKCLKVCISSSCFRYSIKKKS